MGVVRKRILLLLCAVTMLFIIGIVGWQWQEKRRLGQLYEQASSDTCRIANKLVELRGEKLAALAFDYTYWDEMVDFVRTRDPQWAKNNLASGMVTYGADAIIVYNPSGVKVYSVASSKNPSLWLDGLGPKQIKHFFSAGKLLHFFLQNRRGLLEVRGAKIVPSADAKRTGPARGYLLACQVWDSGYLNGLGSLLDGTASLRPISGGSQLTPGEKKHSVIALRTSLRGPDGRSLRTLCLTKRFAEGDLQRSASRMTIIVMGLFVALMIMVIFFGLSQFVARPLGLISSAMETQSPDTLSHLRKDPSEFGRLATLVGEFFHQKAALEEETRVRARAEADARRSEQDLSATLNSISDGFYSLDDDLSFTYFNSAAETMLRRSRADVIGKCVFEVFPELKGSDFDTNFALAVRDKVALSFEANGATPSHWYDVRVYPQANGISVYFQDVTERKNVEDSLAQTKAETEMLNRQLEQALHDSKQHALAMEQAKEQIQESVVELAHQATHDALTGLPNRSCFEQHLSEIIADGPGGKSRSIAVLFLDLDRFKLINDTLGHKVGDLLLVEVAGRLRSCLRPGDELARMGGDEFTVILTRCESRSIAESVACRMIDSISRPFEIQGRRFVIGASIGLASYPSEGKDPVTLLKHADAAMYKAKQAGRGTCRWFTGDVDVDNQLRAEMEMDIRAALEKGQFGVYYQPIISLQGGNTLAAEALLRWEHPEKGMISPSLFIPIAEEIGMIGRIGDYVLRTACAQAMAWRAQGIHLSQIGVNLSTRQVREGGWLDSVSAALADTGLEARCLNLELTETDFAADYTSIRETLWSVQRLGISMSIEGQSSLGRLRDFPMIHLKIDGSFIRGIEHNQGDSDLVRSIVEMAHGQGALVTAEWVETELQMEILRAIGCDLAQGYFISPALSSEDFADFVREWTLARRAVEAA